VQPGAGLGVEVDPDKLARYQTDDHAGDDSDDDQNVEPMRAVASFLLRFPICGRLRRGV